MITPEQIIEVFKHIEILNGEMGGVQTDVAILKVQMTEVLWVLRGIAGAFFIILVQQFMKLIRNGKKGGS